MALTNTDFVQLPADSSGKRTAMKAAVIGGTTIYLPAAVLYDESGNQIDSAAARLAGTERGLAVRSILDRHNLALTDPPIPVSDVTADARTYMAASFRLTGAAASPTNLFTIENQAGSPVVVKLRRISVDVAENAATAYLVASTFRLWLATGVSPTGGTQPAKTPTDSTVAVSDTHVVLRFPASADGTASVITHALPARSPDRSQAHPTSLTAVGQWLTEDNELVTFDQVPLTLNAGETALVALVGNSATVFNYTVKAIWEEH